MISGGPLLSKTKLFPLFLCPTLPKEFLPCEFKGYHRRWSLIVRTENHRNCKEMNLNNCSWEDLEQFLWTQKNIEATTQKIIHYCVNKNVLILNSSKPVSSPKQPQDDAELLIFILHEKTQWWQSKENHNNFSPYTRTTPWIIKLPWSLMLRVQRFQAKFRSPTMIKDFFENW